MALTWSGTSTRGLSSSLLSALLCSDCNCFVGMSQCFSLGFGHTDAYDAWTKETRIQKDLANESYSQTYFTNREYFLWFPKLFFRTPHVFLNRCFAIEILPRRVSLFFHTIVRHPNANISAFLEEGISKKKRGWNKPGRFLDGIFRGRK